MSNGKAKQLPNGYIIQEVKSFTQEDINNNLVWYQHYGSDDDPDLFRFEVSDDANPPNVLKDQVLHIEIFSLQDQMWFTTEAPRNLGITVTEGSEEVIQSSQLTFQLEGVKPNNVLYTVTSPLKPDEGMLVHRDKPEEPVITFTQADINDMKIIFKSPSLIMDREEKVFDIKFAISDKQDPRGISVYPEQLFLIYVKPVNIEPPEFNFPDPEISVAFKSGTVIPIERRLLTVTDPDTDVDQLVLTVTKAPMHGTFLYGIEGHIITEGSSFPYLYVLNDSFYYVPDNVISAEDKIGLAVYDGKQSSVTTLTIKSATVDLNGPVALDSASLSATVKESHFIILQRHHLAYFHPETDDSEIVYTLLSDPTYGRLDLIPGDKYFTLRAGDQFTQQNINNMILRYTASDEIGLIPVIDNIYFNVSNGKGNIQPYQVFTIVVMPTSTDPTVTSTSSEILVEEGKDAILGSHLFASFDFGTFQANVTVVIDVQPKFGHLENHKPVSDSEKSFIGLPISSFLFQDVIDLHIRYIQSNHRNKEPTEDVFLFHLTDRIHSSSISHINVTIQLINDEPPVIITGQLIVEHSHSAVIQNSSLYAIDMDTSSEQLRFIINVEPQYGTLKKLKISGQTLMEEIPLNKGSTFTYQDILYEMIVYLHDGRFDNEQDSFTIAVTDGDFHDTQTVQVIILSSDKEIPRLSINKGLEVTAGTSEIIHGNVLRAMDEESDDEHLLFNIIEDPQFGNLVFRYNGYDQIIFAFGPVNSFSQEDINFGRIVYLHNEESPIGSTFFKFFISDSAGNRLMDQIFFITVLVPTLQFSIDKISVPENQRKIEVTVIRQGDTKKETSVICYTKQATAKAGKDFVERPNTEISKILFLPGEKNKICVVSIIDDHIHEDIEYFYLKLNILQGEKLARTGSIDTVHITITNSEDVTTVQFEYSAYSIQEPSLQHQIVVIPINVFRNGDINMISHIRISTRDGTAVSGIDYHAKSTLLSFNYGETNKIFELEVIYNKERDWHKMFSLIIGPDEPVNAKLGNISVATITISDHEASGSLILPSPPIVISLLDYDNIEEYLNKDPSPGYPIICVTPCDQHYPNYNITQSLCEEAGISESNIYFSWEVALHTGHKGSHPIFHLIQDSTIFTSVHHKVLDSIHFGSNFLIRCIAQPQSSEGYLGIPLRSNIVKIGNNGICNMHSLRSHSQFHSQSFVATLHYLNSSNTNHPNRLHIHLEIPHQDGLLPLVSTYPLHNINYLLKDSIYRQQHVCSNLLVTSDSTSEQKQKINYGFLNPFDSSMHFNSELHYSRPYQFDSNLREERTLLLYQHLDLKGCIWIFDAWYHMTELVDLCGGTVVSDFQVRDTGQTYLTVHLPLYVSYVYSVVPVGWTSMEHHTELEFSFFYNTVLWRSGLETDSSYQSRLQVLRIVINKNGNLMIEFKTQARFRGLFVLEHHTIPDLKSRVIPPENLLISFHLELLWTEQTFDGPMQLWRATSKYNLKDYTGVYLIELIPCIVKSDQSYTSEQSLICTGYIPEKFEVPLVFQQTNRPVPVIYSLNTIFQIVNNEKLFLLNPFMSSIKLHEVDYKGTFSKGQIIYGKVLWSPDQDLESAYKLRIERLYICTGRDGYIPTFDPTGEEYDEGPQFGCIQKHKHLKHRFLILDLFNPEAVDQNFNNIPFEAKFAHEDPAYKALEDIPGVDGFILKVDALYKIDSGNQWFLQVMYTIGSSDRKQRIRRSATSLTSLSKEAFESLHTMERNLKKETWNGTNLRAVFLSQPEHTTSENIKIAWIVPLLLLLLLITMFITFKYYRRRKLNSRYEKQNRNNLKKLNTAENSDSKDDNEQKSNTLCRIRTKSLDKLNSEVSVPSKSNTFNITILNNLMERPISGTEV